MKAQIVSFHCVLKNKLGRVLSSTFNNDVITGMEGSPEVLQGLVEGLQNLRKGEKRKILVSAEKAYGFYDPKKVIECACDEVESGSNLRMGDLVYLSIGKGKPRSLRVVALDGERITLDGNHPLAGQDLIFEIEATKARDATLEELNDNRPDSTGLH